MRTWPGSSPGSTRIRLARLRSRSVEPAIRTTAVAVSAITRALRSRCREPPAAVRSPLPRRISATSGRDARQALTIPAAAPERTARPNANSSTGASRRISPARGRFPGSRARIARSPSFATRTPRAPPASASSRLSASSSRTSAARPAPSAARTPSSRRRASPRASSRPVTLAAAIASTSTTAANSTPSGRRAGPSTWSTRATANIGWACVYCRAQPATMASISGWSRSSSTPSRSRPTTDRWWLSRRAGSRVIGSQRSAPSSGKRNAAGITPAIRRETPSSTIVPPTAPGSAPNRLRHRPSLSTATGSAPAASSPSRDRASRGRRRPEHGPQRRRRQHRADLRRLAAAGERGGPLRVRAGLRQQARRRAVVEILRVRHRELRDARVGHRRPHLHQAVGLRQRERSQQHVADDARDRGGRADPEREGDENDGGEAGGAGQRANDLTQRGCHGSS